MNFTGQNTRLLRGFSLIENLFSLLAIVLIIPTALATITLSLDLKRDATLEAKSIEIAEYVFHQVHYAWKDEQSVLFPHSARNFPSIARSEKLSILFTENLVPYDKDGALNPGDIDWKLSNSHSSAIPVEIASGYVVTLLQDDLPEPAYNTENIRRFTVQVAHPAGAPARSRTRYTYSRLIRR